MFDKESDLCQIFSHLESPISLLPQSEASEAIKHAKDSKDGIFRYKGLMCLYEDPDVYCTEDHPGAADTLRMLGLLIRKNKHVSPGTREEALRQLLTGNDDDSERNKLVRQFLIPMTGDFRLAVFRIEEGRHAENAYHELMHIFPLEECDLPVQIRNNEFVLIRDCEKGETDEDIAEYCLALCDTAESEADIRLKAGISSPVSTPLEFNKAYTQGREAIMIATRFSRIGPVWIYDKLLLERFLNEIPSSIYDKLRNQVMTDEVRKLMTGEMLDTVNMFFKCDLNLSDTARQMFIHRNTLMYRLDKIQKITGLDLRKFYDSVVFRIIMESPME